MPIFAREVVTCRGDRDGARPADRHMDYVAASVASPAKYTDRFAVATPSERRRNRHDVWRLIIESGLNTYREVAEDYGVSVQAVRYGVEQSYARRRRLAEAM